MKNSNNEKHQRIKNTTSIPEELANGIEELSGSNMENVIIHSNSSKPAQLNAYAYAQGSDIHVAPGQEKHLPHEKWTVVQQHQGRIQPTLQMNSNTIINDEEGLEQEADLMGEKAVSSQINPNNK